MSQNPIPTKKYQRALNFLQSKWRAIQDSEFSQKPKIYWEMGARLAKEKSKPKEP